VAGVFTAEQLSLLEQQTEEILVKMNSTRNSPGKPKLKKEYCVMVRHLSPKSLNWHNFMMCPNDPNFSKILEMGIKNSV